VARIHIHTPLTEEVVVRLRAGDRVLLSGKLYTARDAAHRRMVEALERGEPLPISLQDEIIYYVGPTPAQAGAGHRFGRADDQRADGSIHAAVVAVGSAGHDRQRQAQ